jgi:hypothetical protein
VLPTPLAPRYVVFVAENSPPPETLMFTIPPPVPFQPKSWAPANETVPSVSAVIVVVAPGTYELNTVELPNFAVPP